MLVLQSSLSASYSLCFCNKWTKSYNKYIPPLLWFCIKQFFKKMIISVAIANNSFHYTRWLIDAINCKSYLFIKKWRIQFCNGNIVEVNLGPPNMQDIRTPNIDFARDWGWSVALPDKVPPWYNNIFLHKFHLALLHIVFGFLWGCWKRYAWNMFHLKLILSMLFWSVFW